MQTDTGYICVSVQYTTPTPFLFAQNHRLINILNIFFFLRKTNSPHRLRWKFHQNQELLHLLRVLRPVEPRQIKFWYRLLFKTLYLWFSLIIFLGLTVHGFKSRYFRSVSPGQTIMRLFDGILIDEYKDVLKQWVQVK